MAPSTRMRGMAEFMALLDFPPAPKLDIYGALDSGKASAERILRDQVLVSGL